MKMLRILSKISLVLGLVAPCAVFAAAGDLDATFGTGGKAPDDGAIATAIQADAKILSAKTTGNYNFAVSRWYPNGTLDTAFGTNGTAIVDIAQVMYNIPPSGVLGGDNFSSDEAFDVAVQADGKILVAGYTHHTNPPAGLANSDNIVVVRFLANGLVDTTFGKNGVAMAEVLKSGLAIDDRGYGMAVQTNGAIVVTGEFYQDTNVGDFVTVRFTSTGVMDTTFASTGYKITSLSSSQDIARDVAIQSDGKIVVVGDKASTGTISFGVVRYNSNGTPDTTFGPSGIRSVNFASSTTNRAYSVAIQSNAKLVVGGYSYTTATNADFALARFNTNGTLDTTFDGDGKVNTNFGTNSGDTGSAVKIQGDGKIVMVGTAGILGLALTRYNTNGSLDTTFSGDGKVTHASISGGNNALIQGDGKIVTSGGGYLARILAQ